MPRHLLHIGYHKSATTWFQQSYYPLARGAHYVKRDQVQRAFLADSALQWQAENARRLLRPDDEQRLILCEEGLSGYLHNGGLFGCLSKDMAHRLKAVFPSADIVIFIRCQTDIIAACYTQYVRGGGTFSVNRYLWPQRHLSLGAESRYDKIPRFTFDHFEYLSLVRLYVELFGRERVHVFTYETLRDDPSRFLPEFEKRFELKLDRRNLDHRPRNVSYQSCLLPVARLLNLFTRRTVLDKHYIFHVPHWYSVRRRFLDTLNRLPLGGARTPERLLGPANMRAIQRRYHETNRILAREFDLPLGHHGYPL